MKSIFKACALAAITLACSVSAHAADQFYVGGSVGRGAHNLDDDYTSRDDSDTGYKVYGGYRFSKELSVEATYFDFGDASGKYGVFTDKFETSAFGVGIAYSAEFSQKWSLIARLGLASVKTKGSTSAGGVTLGSESEDNIKAYVGLGLGYAITPQLKVEGSWDFTQGEVAGAKGRVDLLSLGVNYSF